MDGIKIEVTGNIARVIEKPSRITSGTVGLPVEFVFDSAWDNLNKIMVFRGGDVIKSVDNPTVVPWEVLVKPNVWLSIGVYGTNSDGSTAIPTIWANVCPINVGVNPEGDPAADPTLPIWQKLMDHIMELSVDIGGSGVFTVTYTHDWSTGTGSVDKTYEEIKAAIDGNREVQCVYGGLVYHLDYVDGNHLIFATTHTNYRQEIIVWSNGDVGRYINGSLTPMKYIHMYKHDGEAVLDGATNDYLRAAMPGEPETLPYVVLDDGDDEVYTLHLPLLRVTDIPNEDGGWSTVWIFSQTLYPQESDGKAKRYTVKLTESDPFDGSATPNADISVEELDSEGGGGNYELPVASEDTLGGVMPVSQTDDMTQSVGVDKNGRLWAAPSAGGSNEWRLAKEVTLEETVKAITISEDDDGNPLNASEIFYEWYNPSSTESRSQMYITIYNADGSACTRVTCGEVNQQGSETFTAVRMSRLGNAVYVSSATSQAAHRAGTCSAVPAAVENDRITKILIATDGRMQMYAGATLKLYVRG